jgi:hypothetical protein
MKGENPGISVKKIPGQSTWDLWWRKWHCDRFFPEYFGFPCQFHSTGAPLQGKTKKKLIIFIAGLHNKPQGCGASAASAAGPFNTKKTQVRKMIIIVIIDNRIYNYDWCNKWELFWRENRLSYIKSK